MGYRKLKRGPTAMTPGSMLMRQQRAGLGDLTTDVTSLLPDPYSAYYGDTGTITGLPLVWEMGLGALGAVLLWSLAKRTGSGVRRRVRRVMRS